LKQAKGPITETCNANNTAKNFELVICTQYRQDNYMKKIKMGGTRTASWQNKKLIQNVGRKTS